MRIAYIILSCAPYLKTRAVWQRNTWQKFVDPHDVYYIVGRTDISGEQVYGYPVGDGYECCPHKYIAFFKDQELPQYDWLFFIDDDTFIFPKRLITYLEGFDSTMLYYIGRELDWPELFMSGGAGFALSRPAYKALHDYICDTPQDKIPIHGNGDVSMGIWMKNVQSVNRVNCMNLNACIDGHHTSSPPEVALTYHYVTEELFAEYFKRLSGGVSQEPR